MKTRILILGAGFGGLELSTQLSEALGESADVTLIDKSDSFMFGFSKLDVMFGHADAKSVHMPYEKFLKPGVRFRQETITAIDPAARRVTTDKGMYEADHLVVALGAEYDFAATPGFSDVNEFYTMAGAAKLRDILPRFERGRALIGVCGAPFKCPPAPSECALMLHDYLEQRGVRQACEISMVLPLSSPVPPSPETSKGADRGIRRAQHCVPGRQARRGDRRKARRRNARRRRRDAVRPVPRRAEASRAAGRAGQRALAQDGVDSGESRVTLETRFEGVSTPSATAPTRARRRPGCSPSAPRKRSRAP